MLNDRRRVAGRVLAVAALLAIATAALLPKLGNGFVIDDDRMIVDGSFIHDPANLRTLLFQGASAGVKSAPLDVDAGGAALKTYRPVSILSFFWDAAVSGRESSVSYHVTNLLAHLACTVLVLAVAGLLVGGTIPPLAIAFIFAIHPVLAEAHVWINGRSDLFCTFFVLAMVLLWWRKDSGRLRLALASLSFLLALLAKETAVTVLIPLLLWDAGIFRLRVSEIDRRAVLSTVRRGLWLVAPLVAYLVLRGHALSGVKAGGGGALKALLAAPYIILLGVARLVAPISAGMRPQHELTAQLSITWLAGAWLLLAACAVLLIVLRRRAPVLAFGAAWFACTLAPAVLVKWPGFDRYLYLPAVGLLCGVASVLAPALANQSARRLRLAWIAFGAYAVVLLVSLETTIRVYRSDYSFYRAAIEEWPESAFGWFGVGVAEGRSGNDAEAAKAFEAAAVRSPEAKLTWYNLAQAYLGLGRDEDALRVARHSLARGGASAPFYNMAALALRNTRPEEAARQLADGLRADPSSAECLQTLHMLTGQRPDSGVYRTIFALLAREKEYAAVAGVLTAAR